MRLAIWGSSSRGMILGFVWLSLGLTVACIAYAALRPDPYYYLGAFLIFGALHYWLAIRWVDNHGTWKWDDPGES